MTAATRQRIRFIISDFLTGNLAWFLFDLVRYYTLPYNYSSMSLGAFYSMPPVIIGQAVFPIMLVCLYALTGFYNEVFFKSRVANIINTFGVSLLGAIIIFFIALFNDSIEDRLKNYEMVMILWLMFGTISFIPRAIIINRTNALIKSKKITFNTLIVGVSEKSKHLAAELAKKYPSMGFNIVGMIDDHTSESGKPIDTELTIYDIKELDSLLETTHIDSFIISYDKADMRQTMQTINRLFPTGKSIYITPDIHQLITLRPRTQMVSGEVLIDVSRSQIPESTANMKRVSDIIISLLTLVLISPILGCIALMVKRSSPGPVIYKQERIGYKKKPFKIYKFRTMYVDSEVSGPMLSTENDKRITPLGKVLRKYRLDELPQFWNVVKGDMSIVGPRPEREYYLRQIFDKAPYFSLLQQVRPGITSWGMVKYGYASSVEEMLERAKYDLLYINNVSLIVDLKILLYTFETVITGKGI